MHIHTHFIERMKQLLGEEYEEFIKTYDSERHTGIRVNRLKISVEEFLSITPFDLSPIPWTVDGFYLNSDHRPSKHPHYHLGLYYIQEPSAMLPASLISHMTSIDHETVLDLCASPGGKTLQLAAAMANTGTLVSNDISPKRIKGLLRNIELYGVKNAIIVNGDHLQLAAGFDAAFDRIVVDAPCSGEGMFRKDIGVLKDWTPDSNDTFAALQKDIAERAVDMLAEGGELLYSTCTFSPKENEEVIAHLLDYSEHLQVEPVADILPESVAKELSTPEGYGRVWPHRSNGEGHFAALLRDERPRLGRKNSSTYEVPPFKSVPFTIEDGSYQATSTRTGVDPEKKGKNKDKTKDKNKDGKGKKSFDKKGGNGSRDDRDTWTDMPDSIKAFIEENMTVNPFEKVVEIGFKYYVPPEFEMPLGKIPVVRSGWWIGENKNGRFEPVQAFAMGCRREDFKRVIDLPVVEEQDLAGSLVVKYLKGETLFLEGEDGFTLVCYEGYPLGFAKIKDGVMKNLYHPAWRLQ